MTMNEVNAVLKLYNLRLRKRKNGMYWVRALDSKEWQPVGVISLSESNEANAAVLQYVLETMQNYQSS